MKRIKSRSAHPAQEPAGFAIGVQVVQLPADPVQTNGTQLELRPEPLEDRRLLAVRVVLNAAAIR